ncbi:uncharacterized protein LOC118738382 [Rhagoletis pomonella]|uniref:uncharacterized protein LOC118738382 n=1 Tax=Rhagoletis pomonella TaxID=28610 RepID=UPI00177EA641|nr:uncharacterized protein LOC118738382 [Rhagoletis pomonella]
MKLIMIFLFYHFSAILLLPAQALPYSPWLSTQRYGPLYEGVKLLIADAEFQAELTFNETEYQLNESVSAMHEMQSLITEYEHLIGERLHAMLANSRPTEAHKHCYHQHELAIATFDRELLEKRRSCKRMLEVSLTALKNEANSEIHFIRSAAAEARNVVGACNVAALKRHNSNIDQVGIAMCVVGRIGALNQRLFEASQNFFDEIAAVMLDGDDVDDVGDSCGDFDELRQQFERVYADISNCIARGGS